MFKCVGRGSPPYFWVFYWSWSLLFWQDWQYPPSPLIHSFPTLIPEIMRMLPCSVFYTGVGDGSSGPQACIASTYTPSHLPSHLSAKRIYDLEASPQSSTHTSLLPSKRWWGGDGDPGRLAHALWQMMRWRWRPRQVGSCTVANDEMEMETPAGWLMHCGRWCHCSLFGPLCGSSDVVIWSVGRNDVCDFWAEAWRAAVGCAFSPATKAAVFEVGPGTQTTLSRDTYSLQWMCGIKWNKDGVWSATDIFRLFLQQSLSSPAWYTW